MNATRTATTAIRFNPWMWALSGVAGAMFGLAIGLM